MEDRPTSLVGRMVLVRLEPARDLVVRSSLVEVVNVALRDELLLYPSAVLVVLFRELHEELSRWNAPPR